MYIRAVSYCSGDVCYHLFLNSLVLSYLLCYLILSCLVLSYLLCYFILSCLVLFCFVLSCFVLPCFVLSRLALSCLVYYVCLIFQWPQELDAQLEIPTDESGAPKSKVKRNEKTGVWSHQEGSEEFLNPLGSNFSSMILEESMLDEAGAGAAAATGGGGGKTKTPPMNGKETSVNPELNNMYRLHGNVPQRVRQEVYKKFCKAKSGILVSPFSSPLFRFAHAFMHALRTQISQS
jgi:hypothetical protein